MAWDMDGELCGYISLYRTVSWSTFYNTCMSSPLRNFRIDYMLNSVNLGDDGKIEMTRLWTVVLCSYVYMSDRV